MAQEVWDVNMVEEGFKKLYNLLGRMPTATEIDAYEGLPSARQMQRRFGGLVKLREQFGYKDTDLSKGEHRSNTAREMGIKGLALEQFVGKKLINQFGDICVHQQRPFEPGKRLDFYVFSPSGNFGVDVFTAKNVDSIKKNLRIKNNTYYDYRGKLYLVYDCPTTIEQIIDGSVVVLSLAEFLEEVKGYKRHEIQVTY